jgi:putative FmdB family regulatory protein
MPLYEYQCRSCGQKTEVLQSFNDPPRTVCEACGGELKKLMSAPAVQFKGSGWYVTD